MNTIFTNTLKTLALGLILAASVHSVQASAIAHTYVSSMGDDGNPCTHTQTCATFQRALAVTSPGGTVTALDASDYGPVSITQSVTIDGTGTQASIIMNSTLDAITVTVPASNTVTLIHLTLTSLPQAPVTNGITLNSGNLDIDDCKISGFTNAAIIINESNLPKSGSTVLVENTKCERCFYGIFFSRAGFLSLRNVIIQGNSYGLFSNAGSVDISHSLITQNSAFGLYAYQSTQSVSNCMISANGTAVTAEGGSTIRLTGNDLFNNTTGIAFGQSGGNPLGIVSTAGNNHKAGSTTPGSVTPGRVIVTQ